MPVEHICEVSHQITKHHFDALFSLGIWIILLSVSSDKEILWTSVLSLGLGKPIVIELEATSWHLSSHVGECLTDSSCILACLSCVPKYVP
jgi:hypothetical protein